MLLCGWVLPAAETACGDRFTVLPRRRVGGAARAAREDLAGREVALAGVGGGLDGVRVGGQLLLEQGDVLRSGRLAQHVPAEARP